MRDIRKRPQLKSAAERKLPPKPVVPKDQKKPDTGNLLEALRRKMGKVRKAVEGKEEEKDDDDKGEWD